MGRPAQFTIESRTEKAIVIRDVGPWDRCFTVTNDAEDVVRRLAAQPGQRVFYYDSEGDFGEIVLKPNGEFGCFAFADPRDVETLDRAGSGNLPLMSNGV